mgnify:CR=1 FL=1
MSLRNILIAVVVLLGIAVVYKKFMNSDQPAKPKIALSNGSGGTIIAQPAAGEPTYPLPRAPEGERQFMNYEEVRAYLRELQNEPIPANYKEPEYIGSGITRDEVYEEFSIRYPMFYGYGSTQLLDSIVANPRMYEVMLTENKAIRRQFDPNSKY